MTVVQETIRADKKELNNFIYCDKKWGYCVIISKGFKIKHFQNRIDGVSVLLFQPISLVDKLHDHNLDFVCRTRSLWPIDVFCDLPCTVSLSERCSIAAKAIEVIEG